MKDHILLGNNKYWMPKVGDVLELIEDADHGDWKTVSVRPEKYPTLKQGTKVFFLERFNNFYGLWITVETECGGTYDIEPRFLKQKGVIWKGDDE